MRDASLGPSLFRNRNFIALYAGQSLSSVGSAVYSFALLWDMKLITNNPFLMALVGIGWVLPQVTLGSFAGVLVDRWSKRAVMLASDIGRLALTAAVTALAFAGSLRPIEIIVAVFVGNAMFAFFNPASSALTPLIVHERQLPTANGLNQIMGPLSMIVGPALSAGIIAWLGIPYALALNALTFLVSVGTLALLRVEEPGKVRRPFSFAHLRGEYTEGFRVLFRIRVLAVLIPVGLLLNFLYAPMDVYLVQFATEALHKTQVAVAELNAAFALGMLCGSLALGPLSRRFALGILFAASLIGMNAAYALTSIVLYLPADIVFLFAMGLGIGLVNVMVVTLVQVLTPKAVLGRVFGLVGTVFNASNPLGLLVGGTLATIFPVQLLMGSVGLLGTIVGLVIPFNREVRAAHLPDREVQEDQLAAAHGDTFEGSGGLNLEGHVERCSIEIE